jgi:DNA-binding LytR/AlgR family response regulator
VPLSEVEWFEARDDYVRLHTAGGRHLVHATIGELERRTDPTQFLRIHRSHMVRLDRITAIHRTPEGRLIVELKSGVRLNASRSRAPALRGIGL